MYDKPFKICQSIKKRNTLYENLPPKNTAELKPWDSMNVELIGIYRNSIRKQNPGGAIIRNDVSMTYMAMINPATGWFEVVEIPTKNLDEVIGGNDEYI